MEQITPGKNIFDLLLYLFNCSPDIDECGLNETLCGSQGFCENRLGSFRCLCDQGYRETEDGQGCVGKCCSLVGLHIKLDVLYYNAFTFNVSTA